MTQDPAENAWPRVPVPSVPGDVWHWQLETMHVVSRVRSDLRARVAHPAVCSGSTEDARDGLLLVFEELASNALRHGGGDVRALVVAGPNGWLLDLSDEAPDRPPVPAAARDPALGGMGLHLVAQLSTDYGWEGRRGRKHVWARLPSGRTEGSEWQRNQVPEPRAPPFPRDYQAASATAARKLSASSRTSLIGPSSSSSA